LMFVSAATATPDSYPLSLHDALPIWPMVRRFEQEFAAYIGVRHAIAVANGTVALHAALLGVGVQPGDRVVTTPFTFIATANSILDRKSTRLNSSHVKISYAVFCLKKK